MAEKVIRIRVVAAADDSLRGVFRPIEQEAARVHTKLQGGSKQTAAAATREAEKTKREQAKTMDALMGHAQKRRHLEEAHMERLSQLQARGVREHEKAERARTTTQIRESRRRLEADSRVIREVEQQQRLSGRRGRGRRPILTGAEDWGGRVVGPLGRGARAVMGGVGELARGAGIDWSPGTLMARRLETEDSARRATVSGLASQGKVATQKDVDESMLAVVAACTERRPPCPPRT